MANVEANHPPYNPLNTFKLLCWARARLWQIDEFDLDEAVDVLLEDARRLEIEVGEAQAIMAAAFAEVRDDL